MIILKFDIIYSFFKMRFVVMFLIILYCRDSDTVKFFVCNVGLRQYVLRCEVLNSSCLSIMLFGLNWG